MQSTVNPWRVFVKGAALFLLIEYFFITSGLSPATLNVYDTLGLLRQRFPVSTYAPMDRALDVGNLNAMFASHVVSQPKAADEFRVLVFGDSAVWGISETPDQTLPGQLNSLGLTCGDKTVRFYNVSYPRSSATKDLMILDKAAQYQPDLIIWVVTLYTLMPKTRVDHPLITQNPDEFYQLAERFDFLPKNYGTFTLMDQITAKQRGLFRTIRYEAFSLINLATGVDQIQGNFEVAPHELSRDLVFEGMVPPTVKPSQLSIDQVEDFYMLAGSTPIVLVNEPILIEKNIPNSDVRYNYYYPRWVYDQYRQQLGEAASQNGWGYLDLWNIFPPDSFTNTPLHLNPQSERKLAETIAPSVQKACP